MAPPIDYRDLDRNDIGVDEGKGRLADVSIDRCKHCTQQRLHRHCALEAFSELGRRYRGLVTSALPDRATPAGALGILAGLPWHLYDGSYYDTSGKRSDLPLDPNFDGLDRK